MSNVPPPPPGSVPPRPPAPGESPSYPPMQGYPPGYGYSYGPAPVDHPSGSAVLVLGILSIAVCSVLGPIAWVKGHAARKEMAAQPHVQWSNRGNVTAGWICGIIATCILALVVIALIIVVAAGAAAS